MEGERLQVLEHYPAMTLHDRLRRSRRPGGVENPERVVKRNERHLFIGGVQQELTPDQRVIQQRLGGVLQERHKDCVFQVRQRVADLLDGG